MESPWKIQSIYELQYFNCPSCIFKDKSKQEFINHACQNHPETIEHLKNIQDKSLTDVKLPWSEVSVQVIKTEPICESEIFQENIEEPIENPLNIDHLDTIKTENNFENVVSDVSENTNIQEESFESFTCPIRKKKVKSLTSHKKNVHEGKKKHKCLDSDMTFSVPSDLKKHVKAVHEGVKDYKCDVCGKEFLKGKYLKRHIDKVHEGIKFTCNICEKSFTSKNSLNDHVRFIHEKIGQNCEICNKTVASAAGLRFHIKTVHGK